MKNLVSVVSLSVCAACLGLEAAAQERHLNFALRGGASVAPAYPGSDDFEVGPSLGLSFGSLKWGPIDVGNGIGGAPAPGLSLRGAFRVIGDRKASDHVELAGLEDIDTAVELGLGLRYQDTNWRAFGELRKGITGHSGVTATLGSDMIFRPTDRLTITAGPRLNFGDSTFAQTYFGVSGAEAAATSFSAFDAEGGMLGIALEVGARYALDDRWALDGAVVYERLSNDAANSPITLQGSEDQWRVNFGVSRTFDLRF